MQTCTLVIEAPTEPISLGMRIAGGRVLSAHEGEMGAEKYTALRCLFMEISDLRLTKASRDCFVAVLSEKVSRVRGIAHGIHFSGLTTLDELHRMHRMVGNAYDMRFHELCCEHIPGWDKSRSHA